MKTVKVLIADDSVVYRTQIRAARTSLPWVEIIGTVANGRQALDRLEVTATDLLILDLEMPEMDGLQTLTEMRARNLKCKVLVFSSASKRGAEITFQALRLGASDFIAKPGSSEREDSPENLQHPSRKIRSLLEPKVLALFPNLNQPSLDEPKISPVQTPEHSKVIWDLFDPGIIVIGASTGGPTVLENIFSQLAPPLRCPILITQHMPPLFTATLAERIQKISGIPTQEGINGAVLEANRVYIAPGDFHMSLTGTREKPRLVLDQGPLVNSVRPAVDNLFVSAANIFKDRCLGIVLTGMGADGMLGAVRIKQLGGAVAIQSENTCIVFGMPGAVMASGAYDRVLSPAEITSELQSKVAQLKKTS